MRIKLGALILFASVSYAAAAGFGFVPGGYLLSAPFLTNDAGTLQLTTDGGVPLTAN